MTEMSSRYHFNERAILSKYILVLRIENSEILLAPLGLANPVAVISIHGRAKLDAVFKGAVSSIFSVTMNSPKAYLFQWNR